MKAESQTEPIPSRPLASIFHELLQAAESKVMKRLKISVSDSWLASCVVTSAAHRKEIEQVLNEHNALEALKNHILSMADDAYLIGHPEWVEIVKEAKSIQ